jgi:2-C-methyl-D-erythritol 2,4-cyclodiphosphate synthase
MKYRIGFGYDVHRLESDLPLILGGVSISFHKGCVAHSDGDVLIHAICDALLGAAALGDIGTHFPDTDIKYKDIDSMKLLLACIEKLREKGFEVGNIDATICMQQPKLASYIPEMCRMISTTLVIDLNQVNVKATTSEGLGFEGREEGVSAQAVALIYANG